MASPTLHLMWKEYRTLRALWLTALVLATLNFVVIVLAWGGDHAVEGLIAFVTAANVFASLLFAGIAICMVFTLETEDRTSLLLFQFAPTWRQMMAGKLTTVFVLAVSLLLTTFLVDGLVAGLMSLTNAIQIRTWVTAIPRDWDSTRAWNVAVVFAAVVLFMIQTAMCFAFLLRKVIGAVLATLSFLLFVAYPLGIYAAEGMGMAGLSLFVVTRVRIDGNPVRRLAPRSTAVQDAVQDAELGCRRNRARPYRKHSSVVVAEWTAQNCHDTIPARMDFGGLAAAGVLVADGKCPVVEGSSQWLGLPARLQSPGLFRDCHITAALASRLSPHAPLHFGRVVLSGMWSQNISVRTV